jgi:hypothetical protein
MREFKMEELLKKCEVSLLQRTFTIYGTGGTIRQVKADNIEEFENIFSYVKSMIGGTDALTFSSDI